MPFSYSQTFNGDLTVPNITMDNPFPENIVLPALSPQSIGNRYRLPFS